VFSDSQMNTQIVKIDTTDIAKNEIHCSTKDGGRLVLKIPVASGFYRIPKSGEYWIVRRQDLTNYYFEGIIVGDDLYGSSTPVEGDGIIDVPNNLKISANAVSINNQHIGVPHYDEFDLTSETKSVELSNVPLSNMIQVFNDGVLIAPSGIVIVEQMLLFTESLSIGKVVVYYMRFPTK